MTQTQAHRVINPVRIATLGELHTLAACLPGWVYRGQRYSEWPLSSSLEREAAANDINDLQRYETGRLNAFLTDPRARVACGPDAIDWMILAAVMQHHGCPTRLVDFTESVGIALYFALHAEKTATQQGTEDAAVWAVNTILLRRMARDQMIFPGNQRLAFENDWVGGRLFNFLRDGAIVDGKGAIVARPPVSNPRIEAQKGLFVYALNLEYSLEDNLYAVYSLSAEAAQKHLNAGFWRGIEARHIVEKLQRSPVIKIIVASSAHDECREHLRRVGITERHLFPDLDLPPNETL